MPLVPLGTILWTRHGFINFLCIMPGFSHPVPVYFSCGPSEFMPLF